MSERIVEIIEFIFREISTQKGMANLDFRSLEKKLQDAGYSRKEIREAIRFVKERYKENGPAYFKHLHRGRSFRYLTPEERRIFSAEAYAYLLQLQTVGFIHPLNVDEILERTFMLGMGEVDMTLLKRVITQVIIRREATNFNTDAVFHPGTDTIN